MAGDPGCLAWLAVDTGGVVTLLQLPLPAPAAEAGHGPGRRHLAVLGGATGLPPGVAQLSGEWLLEGINEGYLHLHTTPASW